MNASKSVRRRWRFGLVAVYLLLALSPFLNSVQAPTKSSPNAQAAPVADPLRGATWEFIDRNSIKATSPSGQLLLVMTGRESIAGNLGNVASYRNKIGGSLQNSSDICDIYADYFYGQYQNGNATTTIYDTNKQTKINVVYRLREQPPNGKCPDKATVNGDVEIKKRENFNITFKYTDQGTIVRVDGDITFSKVQPEKKVSWNGKQWTLYLRTGSNNECQDWLIEPAERTEYTRAYYEELVSGGDGGARKSTYPDQSVVNSCKIKVHDPGHRQNGYIIIGGWAAAKDIQQGEGEDPNSVGGSDDCQISGLGYVLCPAIDMLSEAYDLLKEEVVKMLQVAPLSADTGDEAYQVWNAIRNLSNIFFVIIFLIIIFSNTLSIGLSNYDIKKMLPRLVVAAILVQFSWILMMLAIDVTNIFAAGIASLVGSAIPAIEADTPGGVVYGVAGAVTLGLGLAVGLAFAFPILLFLFGLVLGILTVFLTLQFRLLVIYVLVVLSPLAFVAWILPNTESAFKMWAKAFTRLLIMYPMIVLIFAMANVVQVITVSQSAGAWQEIFAAIVPILAFYAVPWTFKWAGGAMAAANGAFSGLTKWAGSPVSNSLERKDRQVKANKDAARNIKAAELYGKGTLGRARARWMTGNIGSPRSLLRPGQQSRESRVATARLAAAAKKEQKEQVEAARLQMDLQHEGKSYAEKQTALRNIAQNSRDDYQRQAAMESMLDNGMVGEHGLGGLAAHDLDTGNFENNKAWKRLQSEKYGDLSEKAGWIVSQGNTTQAKMEHFARNVSLEQLSKTKADALNQVRTRPGLNAGALGALHTQAVAVLGNARLMQNVKGSWDPVTATGSGELEALNRL